MMALGASLLTMAPAYAADPQPAEAIDLVEIGDSLTVRRETVVIEETGAAELPLRLRVTLEMINLGDSTTFDLILPIDEKRTPLDDVVRVDGAKQPLRPVAGSGDPPLCYLPIAFDSGQAHKVEIEYRFGWSPASRDSTVYSLQIRYRLKDGLPRRSAVDETEITFRSAKPTPLPALNATVPFRYARDSLTWRFAGAARPESVAIAFAPRIARKYDGRFLEPASVTNRHYPWDWRLVSLDAAVGGAALQQAIDANDPVRLEVIRARLEEVAREARRIRQLISEGRSRYLNPTEKLNVDYCRAVEQAVAANGKPKSLLEELKKVRQDFW
ncbi:MAG TPA: hypothetical protein VEY91_12105 [Candidatus Limnocylindria bacterium]|nr:hypothetical protein [Candidatus Limnocylindria bacterium]